MTDQPASQTDEPWLSQMWVRLFLLPIGILALLGLVLFIRKPQFVSLLWTDPVGIRMSLTVIAWATFIGTLAFLVARSVRLSALQSSDWSPQRRQILAILLFVWVAVGCLPVCFVLLVGPAAIGVQNALQPAQPG